MGYFGFPKDKCAEILVQEAKKFLVNNTTSLEIVEFCIIDDDTTDHFRREFVYIKQLNN
jgi:O-acetyl-ADP-ribose deacetylase (regulator of RNase III)